MDFLSINADFNLCCLIADFAVLALVLVSGGHLVFAAVFSHFVDTADIVAAGINDTADTVEIAAFDEATELAGVAALDVTT